MTTRGFCEADLREVRDEDYSEEHLDILRAMTPEQKLRAAGNLYWSARTFCAAGVRMRHPDWDETLVQREVSRLFLYASD